MAMRDLLERRSSIAAEMRRLIDNPEDNGDLSDSQQKAFDELKDELSKTEARISRQEIVDAADRAAAGVPLTDGGDDRFDAECRRFSLQKAIAAQIDPRSADAGREVEIGQELAKRSGRSPQGMFVPLNALVERRVQVTTGDAGQLVATEHLASEFIDVLRPNTVVGTLGGRILTGLRGDVAIPKMDEYTPTVEWIGEDSALSTGDHSFAQVTAAPKHAGLITEWSRKVLLQANPAIEQLVRADFTQKLAAGVDLAALKGGGSNEPDGVTATGGIGTNVVGGAIDYDDVLQAVASVEANDVPLMSLGWAVNPWVKVKLLSTTRVSGDAGAGFLAESRESMLGYPLRPTSQLDGDTTTSPVVDGEMIFGAWNQLITMFWGDAGADILVNPYAAVPYSKGNVQIRALVDVDVVVRHAGAFQHLSAITVA